MSEKKWSSRCATCTHLRVSHGYSVPEWPATTCRVPGCRCDAYKAPRASPPPGETKEGGR